MATTALKRPVESIRTLPGDDIRQIMWRFTDRMDLQMLVQSARAVARGPIARLVANGARNTHEWTAEKASIAARVRRRRHHQYLHESRARRLHRRP